MSILFPESVLSTNRKSLIRELLQGHECATKLKFMLQKPIGSDGFTLSAEELLSHVLRSFTETISVLSSSDTEVFDEVGENRSQVCADSSNDLKSSEDSNESKKKRSLTTTTKDRRGSYKRRRNAQTWTNISETIDDNHAWRKYGQKKILNSKFPRSYFRCSWKHDQGCKAMKQVQRIEEKPYMYHITYIGFHTCKHTLEPPQMVTFSDTLDSFLVNSNSETNIPNEKDTPIIKQEYPKEDNLNDVKDMLDPTLWSDLKDLELYKAPIVLSNVQSDNEDTVFSCTDDSKSLDLDFGVFPIPLSTDFHFDESHLL